MKIWNKDFNRFADFGIDLRGSWVHHKLAMWAAKQLKQAQRFSARMDCFCEPCLRESLPWPFNW